MKHLKTSLALLMTLVLTLGIIPQTVLSADAAKKASISVTGKIEKGKTGETREYNGSDYTYYGAADLDIKENSDGTVDYNFDMRDDIRRTYEDR